MPLCFKFESLFLHSTMPFILFCSRPHFHCFPKSLKALGLLNRGDPTRTYLSSTLQMPLSLRYFHVLNYNHHKLNNVLRSTNHIHPLRMSPLQHQRMQSPSCNTLLSSRLPELPQEISRENLALSGLCGGEGY